MSINALDVPGIDPTGSVDSTSGMTAAHSHGVPVYYPSGTYKFSTLSIPNGGIVGDGLGYTVFSCTDTGSGDSIVYTGSKPAMFKGFTLTSVASKAGGAGLNLNGSGGAQPGWGSLFDGLHILQFPIGLHITVGANWKLFNSVIEASTQINLLAEDIPAPDAGDAAVYANLFGGNTPVHIQQTNGGGLRISNNKFISGGIGYLLNYAGATGQLYINNNSFDGQTVNNIQLQRQAGSINFFGVVRINDNFLGGNGSGVYCVPNAQFLTDLLINDNTIYGGSIGIHLDWVTRGVISGNTMFGSYAPNSVGIKYGANSNSVLIGVDNNVLGYATPSQA